MTTIHVPMIAEKMHVIESYENARRYRWTVTTYRKPDGDKHIHTHCEEIPDDGPLMFIPDGPDVDAVAVRDLTAMAKEKPRKPREKPDLAGMYQRFNEVRRREMDSKTVHPSIEVPRGE